MLQKIMGLARRAIDEFNMIEENDKIAIGLSGGKDSLCLLYALNGLKRYYPKKFDIIAITIHPGNKGFDTSNIEEICKKLNVEHIIFKSDISDIVFNIREEKNPCSLCANLRRGILSSVAVENGCNKIALGHHSDDVVETLLMSLFLNGKFHTFSPITHLTRSNITVIRPLIYAEEKQIKSLAKKLNFPPSKKCCPMDGSSKRQYIKDLIHDLNKDMPKIKENIFGAIRRSGIDGWK